MTRRGDILAPSMAGSPKGFDTPDLKEAKALLNELGGKLEFCD